MTKIPAPYLACRPSRTPGVPDRWYFKPSERHRQAGWKVVRLHDQRGRPVGDQLAAAAACRPLSDLYKDWLDGKPDSGPERIDQLGHLIPLDAKPASKQPLALQKTHRPGTIAAIVADYLASKYYLTVKLDDGTRKPRPASTRRAYRQCLDILVAEFGELHWAQISPSMAEVWIEDLQEEAPAFGHSIYRTTRLMLNKARLIYPSDWHPGHVPRGANPFAALDIPTPKTEPMPWPRALVAVMLDAADGMGRPSLGDGILFNSWLGQRTTDLVAIPRDRLRMDRPLWVAQGKTGADVILPWQMVPQLQARWMRMVERREAEKRQARRKVTATTFLMDDSTGKAFDVDRIRAVFSQLREKVVGALAARSINGEARFPAEYLCKHFDDDPFAFDAGRAQMRTLRHTAVTQLADAQVLDIGSVTGHSDDTLSQIIKHYRARTATRAAAAFAQRLTHEGKE